jgi:hypothetical protein
VLFSHCWKFACILTFRRRSYFSKSSWLVALFNKSSSVDSEFVVSHILRILFNTIVTDHCGRVVNIPDLYSGSPRFMSWPGDRPSWQVFVVFLIPSRRCLVSFLKLGHDRFCPNPFHLSPFHLTLFSPSYWKASFNELQINNTTVSISVVF